jgi:creatinine amidohydrolase
MTASRTRGQGEAVRWADLKPEEFLHRLDERPVAYLPMGMVEPHGHAAAFGLDTIKAEYLCDEAASRFGGIVAPPQTTTSTRPASTAPGSRKSWATSTHVSAAYHRTS